MSEKTLIVYSKEGNEVVIDNTPEQIASWEKAGYSRENPLSNPMEANEFVPVIMIKEGEKEKTVDTQKAYDKALKQGWVVKNEN